MIDLPFTLGVTSAAPSHIAAVVAVSFDAVTETPALLGRFLLVCSVSGLLAAIAMDVPMSQGEDGFTPAYVATAVLKRTTPSEVKFAAAMVVHHVVGILAGGLYGVVYLSASSLIPGVMAVGGVGLVPHLAATIAVAAFIYGFFAHFVFPRASRRIYEERATAVRGQWLRAAVVFGVGVGVIVPTLTTAL
jgi:hypothetical protein